MPIGTVRRTWATKLTIFDKIPVRGLFFFPTGGPSGVFIKVSPTQYAMPAQAHANNPHFAFKTVVGSGGGNRYTQHGDFVWFTGTRTREFRNRKVVEVNPSNIWPAEFDTTNSGSSASAGGGGSADYVSKLFAYYTMQEAAAGVADSLGANNFTDHSGSKALITGIIGNGLDKQSPYETRTAVNTNFTFRGHDFTVRFWYMPDNAAPYAGGVYADNILQADSWQILYSWPSPGHNKMIGFEYSYDIGSTIINCPALTPGVWNHVVCYAKNGVLMGIVLNNGTATEAPLTAPQFNSGAGYVSLSGGGGAPPPHSYIDEIAVWKDYALTPADIAHDFNSGIGRTYPLT